MFKITPILSKLVLSICFICYSYGISYANVQTISVPFYGQTIELEYDEEMLYPYDVRIEEMALRQAYERMEKRSYSVLLDAIQAKANELMLNDWLYVQLVRECSKHIYHYSEDSKSELTSYLLLAKSGYDVRLTYRKDFIHINIFIRDVIYEIPIIEEGGRQYANISKSRVDKNSGQSMYLLDHRPNPNGNFCSFHFNRWPLFCEAAPEREISFQFEGRLIELSFSYNKGVAELLNNYPLVDEYWYMEAPLSPELSESLIPQLRALLKGRTVQSSLELLVAFTRSGFVYKEDHAAFGKSKPMVADELFFYAFSDCEDRSALFFSLVKVLLDLPMLVIAYEDHLSIAVSAPGLKGRAVNYQGNRFIFCDPTGPRSSSVIGNVPEGYENKDFEILGIYNSRQSP